MKTNKAILLILDGWGQGENHKSDAIFQANTPVIDDLIANHPHTTLTTFGEEVGLPQGQMGNSEVGHMNIGAGRIVYQDLLKIDRDISSGAFHTKSELVDMFETALKSNGKLHFIGLLSDGGVHSQISHLFTLIDMATTFGVPEIYIHAFLDGRDTDPHGGLDYIKQLQEHIADGPARLATVIGRYDAMDRDKRWKRTKKAFDLLVNGVGESAPDIVTAIAEQYEDKITDEFIKPMLVDSAGLIESGDSVMFFNYRADRPRQLTSMLALEAYPQVETVPLNLNFYSMTPYDATFRDVKVIYDKKPLEKTFGHLLEERGLTQLRMAETEKYPHVTYFFSGGQEQPFDGERRIMINSPKVATYDLKPSMSANELTDALLNDLELNETDFICLNFANTDMVGHTGVFSAAVEAAETVDHCVGRILNAALPKQYHILIIADHGNSDFMINEDGSPNTAHTLNPVPLIYVNPEEEVTLQSGKLADVAVTIAEIMGVAVYDEMDGESLIKK